ncbi:MULTISPECIES: ArsR/SmtB family transcription factor [Actinoalloteichus]|uniref:DNA-binding transcriptional regulator, ArsR family n=1 Tax=Actinoalloteichus caeruleus DSM 43889 TaxID=1120930 RepID=A0ABT1JDS8_ACTCY|nr:MULTISPECIES: helix-turn-helix transcriptional regulator [Actinoalloteichus]MCP2330653.1 DNA-binding transcriptional regulator, ArsR family [Actinoalloteichus caeruleus DSM 43889]
MSPSRTYEHPDRQDIALPRVLFALSEPLRLAMVRKLAAEGEVDSVELGPDLPRSTLTHHTSLLRESGVVHVRAEGRKCMIRLRERDLEERFPGLVGIVLAGYDPHHVPGDHEDEDGTR